MKDFKTIEEQIELLKNRNLTFEDEIKAKEILINNNYYNVINGYKQLFLNKSDEDNFIDGTTFEEIYALYDFDRKLRSIFLEYILKIENSLRSLVAYYFSQFHGNDNYLKLSNFETFSEVNTNFAKKEKQLKHIQMLISNINKKIANSIENKPYIQHYIMNYGFIPMWVLVNILSFGDICNFFRLMKQKERILISSNFNIMEHDLSSLIGILSDTRNLCAHDERLYNFIFPAKSTINDNQYHINLSIPISNRRYVQGKNDLYAVVIALKILLSKEDYYKFHGKIFSRIMSLQSKLKVISIHDVLNTMNFPNNWHDIIKMS